MDRSIDDQSFAQAEPPETPPIIAEALQKGNVSWDLLLTISSFTTSDEERVREIGNRHIYEATEIYKEKWDAEVALYAPVGGVCVHGDGHFEWSLAPGSIGFDWSGAWSLLYELEGLAEEAREWWPDPADSPEENRRSLSSRFVQFLKRHLVRVDHSAVTRRPHSMRAFNLATWVLGATKLENFKHPQGTDSLPAPSPQFEADMTRYSQELKVARQRFGAAAQRTAQGRYWQGAMVGISAVAVLCAIVGLVFWWRGVDAAYAIALPAGSLGAMVSLLQRMSSGKLVLDIDASRDLLEVFGAVRPFIGAIFGMAITALLLGGLIPAIEVPADQELAFFAGIGFLAGFNERWAQDMLRSSGDRMGSRSPADEAVEAPAESTFAQARVR